MPSPIRRVRRAVTHSFLLVAAAAASAFLVSGCSAATTASAHAGPATTLHVAAASSLKRALGSAAPAFERANNVTLVIDYGATGTLAKQIEAGAPVDVFLSADQIHMSSLAEKKLVSARPVAFAANTPAVLVPSGRSSAIHRPGDLVRVSRIAVADPALAPQGAKAREWLSRLGLWTSLSPKLVLAANAAQADDYVARGEVDAAIGFRSDAVGRDDIATACVAEPGEVPVATYVAAPVTASSNTSLAEKFVSYLLTQSAQSAFTAAGLDPAPKKK